MFVTHRYTMSNFALLLLILPSWMAQIKYKVSNWREELKGTINTRTTSVQRRERSGTFQWEPNHLIQEHAKKEKRVIYCFLSCCTRFGTVLIYDVSMDRHQLQQLRPREKRKVYWYYYHLYGSYQTIHYSLYLTYIIIPCQHDTII